MSDQAQVLRGLMEQREEIAALDPAPFAHRQPAQTLAVTSGKGGVGKSCIALNVGITHLRQHSGRVKHFEPLTDELAATIEDPRVEPDARMAELDRLIAALEPLDRALVLLYLDECPHAEIADILGISQTNVATKIGRIKQRLRKQMTGGEHPMERIDGTR